MTFIPPDRQHLEMIEAICTSPEYAIEGAGLVLPIGAKIWPMIGTDVAHLYTEKGKTANRVMHIVYTSRVPEFCAKKMSFFYNKNLVGGGPQYAVMWFGEPMPYGTSRKVFGVVYIPQQARHLMTDDPVWTR